MFKKNHHGFTLVELLVSMTIVAILTSLALVSIEGARKASRDSKRKTDLEQIRSALEICRADSGSYPAGTLISAQNITCGTPPITYITIPNDPISTSYRYVYTRSTSSSYRLCARLETGGGTDCNDRSCGTAGTCNYEVNNP
jgi:general secretion pathway protein G